MKKKYINYLLIAIVLSLCILYYNWQGSEGFQTSPVDFSNFTGQFTGIRFTPTAEAQSSDPLPIFQQLLSSLTESDIKMMITRCNGDRVFPYYYVDNTGNSGASPSINPYTTMVSPETIPAMLDNDFSNIPPYTLNFTLNSKVPPVNLTNQNVNVIFNNIYAKLYRVGYILQSIILNGNTDYPKSPCTNVLVPRLTPNIIVNAATTFTGVTVKTNLMSIIVAFNKSFPSLFNSGGEPPVEPFSSSDPSPIITTTDETGNKIVIDIVSIFLKDVSMPGSQGTNDLTAIRTYTIRNLLPVNVSTLLADWDNTNMIAYSGEYANKFYTGSSTVPASVIQAYYTQLFLVYFKVQEQEFNAIEQGLYGDSQFIPTFNIKSIHLSNPEQDVSLTVETTSSTSSTGNNGSDASMLQQLRKILCI